MTVYFFKLQQWAVKFEVISFYHFQGGFLVIRRDPPGCGGLAWRTLLFFEFFSFQVGKCHLQNFVILTVLIYDKFGTCFGNDLGKDTTNTLKFIPSRELTVGMHMAVLKVMFLLQRWNMFPGV